MPECYKETSRKKKLRITVKQMSDRTNTQVSCCEKRHAFWIALDRVVREVPEDEQLFVFMDSDTRHTHGREGRLGSEECKVLAAYGRDILNGNGERLLSFSANAGLVLLNAFLSTV